METSIDYWRKILLTKEDNDFFELMQNWLGEIETPFNKHKLIERLEQFLAKEQVKERIIDLIDEKEAAILSAIHFIHQPTVELLYKITGDSIGFTPFSLKLINMEQRMLIFRQGGLESEKILINPILRDALIDRILHFNALFPPAHAQKPTGELPWISDSILLALFSYIAENQPQLKLDGNWKKKDKEGILSRIPQLSPSKAGIDRVDLVKTILLEMNLCKIEDKKLVNNIPMWNCLKELPTRDLFILILSSGMLPPTVNSNTFEENGSNPDLKTEEPNQTLFSVASILVHLFKTIPHGVFYTQTHFTSLIEIIDRKNEPKTIQENINRLIEMGILLTDSKGNIAINPIINIDHPIVPPQPAAVIEANFELILKPWVPLSKSFLIPLLANIIQCDLYPHYQISRSSFHRALHQGYQTTDIIEQLEILSQKPLPQNLKHSLEDWEENYRKIRIIEGTLLKATPQETKVIKESGRLTPWILEELAEGLFLMDDRASKQWQAELLHCGISEIPATEKPTSPIQQEEKPILPEIDKIRPLIDPAIKFEISNSIKHQTIKKKKHPQSAEIKKKIETLNLKKEDKKEFEAKMKKKLILFPDQITPSTRHFGGREARGLNFRKKIAVINHAIRSGKELLEITLISKEKEPPTLVLFPIKLIKEDANQILIARFINEKEPLRFNISQIMVVKRLQSSLFIP